MTAVTTRDALVAALHEMVFACPHYEGSPRNCERNADALLSSGAVIDAASLADDTQLVDRVDQAAGPMGGLLVASRRKIVRAVLRALAEVLAERGESS